MRRTFPIILLYLRSNNSEKKFWKKTIQDLKQDNNDFENAIEIIKKYNCIDDTIERARHFANIAKDSLGVFENNEFKKILLNIIDSGLERIK